MTVKEKNLEVEVVHRSFTGVSNARFYPNYKDEDVAGKKSFLPSYLSACVCLSATKESFLATYVC